MTLQWGTLQTEANYNHRCSYTGKHLHVELFHADVFAQTYFCIISDCGLAFLSACKEFSKQMQNRNFTTAVDDWGTFRAKGLQGLKVIDFWNDRNAFTARGSTQNHAKRKSAISLEFWRSSERGYAKPSKGKNRNFIAILRVETHFVGKGLAQHKPTLQLHLNFARTWIHAALLSKRRNEETF